MTSEPRPAPASRTAPRVDTTPGAVAFTFGTGPRYPIGTGPVLAVLFAAAGNAGDAGKMPPGESALDAAPLSQHADRHRTRVTALLRLAGGDAK